MTDYITSRYTTQYSTLSSSGILAALNPHHPTLSFLLPSSCIWGTLAAPNNLFYPAIYAYSLVSLEDLTIFWLSVSESEYQRYVDTHLLSFETMLNIIALLLHFFIGSNILLDYIGQFYTSSLWPWMSIIQTIYLFTSFTIQVDNYY